MKGKKRLFLFIIILIAPHFVMSAPAGYVVIESFKIAGLTSTDEYVEIYNPTNATVNLAGWRLSRKTASGTLSNLLTTFPAYELKPAESLFIGHKNVTTNKGLLYSTATSIAEDNTIILFSDQGKTIVDKVGFGKAGDFERTVLPNPKSNDVYVRKGVGEDSNDNGSDFTILAKTEDEDLTSGTATDYQLFLTEIMPNPKGTDTGNEWIELYNPGERLSLSGVTLTDKEGSVKKYVFPSDKIIEKETYAVFYSKETGISLNNDSDAVELLDSSGRVLDDTDNYDSAKEGYSFAYDGERWVWTTESTPGRENLITEPVEKVSPPKTVKAKAPKVLKEKAKKPTAKKGSKSEVLGATNSTDDLFAERAKKEVSEKDRLLGYILIVVALAGGLLYTLSVNKEKLLEVFNEERSGYAKSWRAIREKFKRG